MHVILIAFQLCFLVILSFFFEKLGLTDFPQKAVNVQFWEYHDCSILHSLQYTQLDRICVLRVCSIVQKIVIEIVIEIGRRGSTVQKIVIEN